MDASYEKLGTFYLGKKFDLASRQVLDDQVCYDARDLTTHAMCVGMTGSGKTGLCLALLEEAAIDGIPAIAIDPKGDLGNLLLSFPELQPSDFRPWMEASEASRQGLDVDALAEKTAATWRSGLAAWDQQPERIGRFRDAVDIAIYTPGSNAGLPLTVLRSFDAPAPEVIQDADLFRERVAGAASALLSLLGMEADPLTSREHILLATIVKDAWSKGHRLELTSLIRLIQDPPVTKVGVFDLESFLPLAERMKLAMSLNNLLASPSFAPWLEGQSLDIRSLLYTPEGKPRLSILSIAHLNDKERMFFVTIFLNELLGWMRAQTGTSSLRALFYMDEIYGYFPPTANPPSKPPMLLLLKQARAFGLGIVLATQNPVDLDYKGLANMGTWFLGRLQTERDKARVLEGLEGAAGQSGSPFDRGAMEQVLASLGSRVFLMKNVHDDGPTVFHSRWALSFLRGPLSLPDIQRLMAPLRAQHTDGGAIATTAGSTVKSTHTARPILSAEVPERFCAALRAAAPGSRLVYRAALLGAAACHYVRSGVGLDLWRDMSWLVVDRAMLDDAPWENARKLRGQMELLREPSTGFEFDELPVALLVSRNYKRWQTQLKDFLYRHQPLRLFQCTQLKAVSQPGQDELDARLGFEQKLREVRDVEMAKLQDKYATLLRVLENKIRTAEQRAEREGGQFTESAVEGVLEIGKTVIGMLLGNKRSRATRTTATVRKVNKAARQRSESNSARETLESLLAERRQLVEELEADLQSLKERISVHALSLTPLDIPCRKSDIRLDLVTLVWIPWAVDADGEGAPLVEL